MAKWLRSITGFFKSPAPQPAPPVTLPEPERPTLSPARATPSLVEPAVAREPTTPKEPPIPSEPAVTF